MKKIFLSVATAIVLSAGWIMYSCSNDDEAEILQDVRAKETVEFTPEQKLINGLQELNEQLLAERPEMATKGGFRTWLNKHKMVLADVAGAVLGGFLPGGPSTSIFFGAAASALVDDDGGKEFLGRFGLGGTRAGDFDGISDFQNRTEAAYKYMDLNQDSLLDYSPVVDVQLDFPAKYEEVAIQVAKKHNLILDILDNKGIDLENYKYELTDEEIKALRSDEFINEFNHKMSYIANLDFSFMDSTKIEYAVIMKFSELYEQYSGESEDVNFIIGKYIEYLENDSTLKEEEKKTIYTGLAVAGYSNDYWTKKYSDKLIEE